MSEVRLVLDLAYGLLMTVLYGAVAWAVAKRKVSSNTELASMAFTHWWAGLALFSLLGMVASVLGYLEAWTFVGYLTYLDVVLVLLVYLLLALMFYFVFLFTGSHKATLGVVAYYIGFLAYLFYWINVQEPVALAYVDGAPTLEYANDLSDAPISLWISLMLLGPLVLGALAYSTLWFRVQDRTQKFRIATVGISIFVWMLTALGGSLGGVSDTATWWLVVSRAVAIAATTANFVAFRPPRWLRERLDLRL